MAGFNGYNNPYNYNQPNYNPYMQEFQNMRDSIDRTMQRYQQQQQQNPMFPQQQIPQINQNFQITPTTNNNDIQAKYVTDINEVKNVFVINTGIFVNRDMTMLWVKNINGDIKTYSLSEIIETDPKDTEIATLKNEIANMRALLNQQVAQNQINNQSETTTTTKIEKKSK